MSCEEIKLLLEAQRSTGLGLAPLAEKKMWFIGHIMCDWEYVDIWNTEKMVLMSNERLNRVERARRKKKRLCSFKYFALNMERKQSNGFTLTNVCVSFLWKFNFLWKSVEC